MHVRLLTNRKGAPDLIRYDWIFDKLSVLTSRMGPAKMNSTGKVERLATLHLVHETAGLTWCRHVESRGSRTSRTTGPAFMEAGTL